jgi:hypothetical protein
VHCTLLLHKVTVMVIDRMRLGDGRGEIGFQRPAATYRAQVNYRNDMGLMHESSRAHVQPFFFTPSAVLHLHCCSNESSLQVSNGSGSLRHPIMREVFVAARLVVRTGPNNNVQSLLITCSRTTRDYYHLTRLLFFRTIPPPTWSGLHIHELEEGHVNCEVNCDPKKDFPSGWW